MAYEKTQWVNNQTKLNATNMNKIENCIETNSNNMPNGINVDSNNYLILEHDGTEVTGQTKKVKLEGGGTPVYKLVNTFFNSDWNMSLTDSADLATMKKCLQDALTQPVYLQTKYLNDEDLLTGPVYIFIGYCYENQYAIDAYGLICDTISGTHTPSMLNIIISGDDIQTETIFLKLKTIFGNKSLTVDKYRPNDTNIDLYKHYLTITAHAYSAPEGSGNYTCYILIQSSSNVDVSSTTGDTKKLVNLLKCDSTGGFYESGVTENAGTLCILQGNSSGLHIMVNSNGCQITSIVDKTITL